jgi:hypothetical protein
LRLEWAWLWCAALRLRARLGRHRGRAARRGGRHLGGGLVHHLQHYLHRGRPVGFGQVWVCPQPGSDGVNESRV